MKIKKHGLKMEQLKREGLSYRKIAEEIGLTQNQVKKYFDADRKAKRAKGYQRSKKLDELKTKQVLIGEVKSLRMEVELLRDFMKLTERM